MTWLYIFIVSLITGLSNPTPTPDFIIEGYNTPSGTVLCYTVWDKTKYNEAEVYEVVLNYMATRMEKIKKKQEKSQIAPDKNLKKIKGDGKWH